LALSTAGILAGVARRCLWRAEKVERTSGRGKGLGAFGWLLRADSREEEEEDWCVQREIRYEWVVGRTEDKGREGASITQDRGGGAPRGGRGNLPQPRQT